MKQRSILYLIIGIFFVCASAYIVYSSFLYRSTTPVEKMSFVSTQCTELQGVNGLFWDAKITLKNDGPKELVIKKIYIDGSGVVSQQYPPGDNEASMRFSTEGGKVSPGETVTISIYIDFGYRNLKTFQRIQVTLETLIQSYSVNVVLQ